MFPFIFLSHAGAAAHLSSTYEMLEKSKHINDTDGFYCYVIDSQKKDFAFYNLLFKLMVIDKGYIRVQNPSFCYIIEPKINEPTLRVFHANQPFYDQKIPSNEDLLLNWGDQTFGGLKIKESSSNFSKFFKEQKIYLQQLYEMHQTESIQSEIDEKEIELKELKENIRKRQESMFKKRVMQRKVFVEFLNEKCDPIIQKRYRILLENIKKSVSNV